MTVDDITDTGLSCPECEITLDIHPEDSLAYCSICESIFPIGKVIRGWAHCPVCSTPLVLNYMPDVGETHWMCTVCQSWWATDALCEDQGEWEFIYE